MNTTTHDKYVKDLKAGDQTEWYEVLEVNVSDTTVTAKVKYNDGGDGTRVWDDPRTIITLKDKLFKLEFGLSPQRQVAICWGARAIYNRVGDIDIVRDRQDCKGGTPEQCKEFAKWLNEYGIPELKKLTLKECLSPNENRRVCFQLNNWFVEANPNGSYGYLYIGVYPVDTGDPDFVPAPVPSPPPPKPEKKKTSTLRRRKTSNRW